MYKIVADSSADILNLPGVLFEAVPLTISTEEREYVDDASLNCHEMLEYLGEYKKRSYTACPSAERWQKAFEGAEEVYVFTMTSRLSGTYNSARLAAELYMEEHPGVRILVFDSLSTGPEMRLHIEKAVELKAEGKTMQEVWEALLKYRDQTRLFFAFASLHNFAQNGRVSKVLASTLGILGISILGTAKEGEIEPINKCRGGKKVVAQMLSEACAAGYRGGKIRICEVENPRLAQKLKEVFQVSFPGADVVIYPARGICSYYGEKGGVIIGCECE